jgi:hypothetical protein
MCEPTTAIYALAALSALASVSQGIQQQDVANYNARVSENNALVERQIGQIEEMRFRRETRRRLAAQRAADSASGFDMTFGTPLALARESAANAEFDAQLIRFNGARSADRFRSAAALERSQGKAALQTGIAGAGLSLLRGYTDGELAA